jgi:hypothetical protein
VQYHDDPVDSYYDGHNESDANRKSKSKLTFKLVLLAIASFIGYSTLGTTFAANVQLSSGVVEFGQGIRVTTACAPSLTLTPYATFANASGNNGAYRLTTIDLTGFGNNCYGKDLIIRAYDSVTANALVLYQTGGTTNYDSLRIYNNGGNYTLAGSGLTQSEISPITGGFRITLFNNASPAAAAKAPATSIYRFAVESAEHDLSLTQTSLPSGSMNFDGTSSTIDYAANSAFVLGTGPFTVELWAKLSTTQSDETFYDAGGNVNNASSFAFWIESNQLKIRKDGVSNDFGIAMDSSWRNNQYHHFAVVRGNGKYRIYVDGVQKGETPDSGHTIDRNAPSIGRLSFYNGYELSGEIRNFRLVKGTALYSADFTPPTVPLSKVSGTLILLLAQDPNNPTKDSSDNVWTPSNSGTLPTYRAP